MKKREEKEKKQEIERRSTVWKCGVDCEDKKKERKKKKTLASETNGVTPFVFKDQIDYF